MEQNTNDLSNQNVTQLQSLAYTFLKRKTQIEKDIENIEKRIETLFEIDKRVSENKNQSSVIDQANIIKEDTNNI